MTKLILGYWKNCGDHLTTPTITLYRNSTDTCDAFGPNCDQTRVMFYVDSANIAKVRMLITCSCKKVKFMLSCGQRETSGLIWSLDEKKRTLTITAGGANTVYKIKTLDKTTLVMTMQ